HFCTSVQIYQATPLLELPQLRQQIERHIQTETELLVDPAFFVALKDKYPEITQVQMRLQRGSELNEMMKYRYSVLLHIEAPVPSEITPAVVNGTEMDVQAIAQYLQQHQPDAVCFSGLLNCRVASDVRCVERLASTEASLSVQQLQDMMSDVPAEAIDPEHLYQLSTELGYHLEACWCAESHNGHFDAVFVRPEIADGAIVLTPLTQQSVIGGNWHHYANNPLSSQVTNQVIQEVRADLEQRLPEYMVPSGWVVLPNLPLTPNGKVDRRALPAPDTDLLRTGEFVAPQTSTEETLAQIWQEVLGLQRVSIHDNFFRVGGDSIISIQIVSRAQQAGLQLTTQQLFEHQTIAKLAAVAGTTTTKTQHQQGLVTGEVLLTPIQHWFFEQNLAQAHHFNQSMVFSVSPHLQPELLKTAVGKILEHHDALRLRFHQHNNSWQQVNQGWANNNDDIPFQVVDLSNLSETEQAASLKQTATEQQASLNLSDGPLMRVVLFQLGGVSQSQLLIIIHHLAVDGVSWRILPNDLFSAYQQLERGEEIQLPPKTTAFQDWAVRLAEYGQSQQLQSELDYWLKQSGSTVASLPVDYPEGDNIVEHAVHISVSLSKAETTALLQEVPSAYNTQINDVLLTALVNTLAAWLDTSTVLITLEGHGRESLFEDVDLSRTVGWFTSMFPVHLQRVSEHPGEALKAIKEQLRDIPQRGIGYGILRYLSQDDQMGNQLAALPQPEVSFNYLGQFNSNPSQPFSGQSILKSAGPNQGLQGRRAHLLDINGLVIEDQLQIILIYNCHIHNHSNMVNLAEDYINNLKSIIAHCQSLDATDFTPSDFPIADLNQEELDALIAAIN
ncbi:condensation domain-containing protein, partial [Moorena sp. SIO3H5]|uniref:condensation domain-containing protein n=1 Tax=Moorena sp. SIO3H5 TaxID=2607834 RepID=UPI0013BAEF98